MDENIIRPLDGYESLVFPTWVFAFVCVKNGHLIPESRLENAVNTALKRNQFLRSRAKPKSDSDSPLLYFTESSQISNSFTYSSSDSIDPADLYSTRPTTFNPSSLPSDGSLFHFTFTSYPKLNAAAVFVAINHAIADAPSAFYWLNTILQLAIGTKTEVPETLIFEKREQLFTKSMSELLNDDEIPSQWSPLTRLAVPGNPLDADDVSDAIAKGEHFACIEPMYVKYDAKKVHEACKAHNSTLQGFLTAAALFVNRNVMPNEKLSFTFPTPEEGEEEKVHVLRCMTPVGLRGNVYSTPEFDFNVCTPGAGAIFPEVEVKNGDSLSFWEVAEAFSEEVRSRKCTEEPFKHISFVNEMGSMSDEKRGLWCTRIPFQTTVNASNIGKLESGPYQFEGHEIELVDFSVYAPGPTTYPEGAAATMIHAGILGEVVALTWSSASFVAKHEKESAERILKACESIC